MKSIEEIKTALPKAKFFFPRDDSGVTRFRLQSTKHKYFIRVVFSSFGGVDVVQAMYRQNFVTIAEMHELKRIFFPPDEWDECVITEHPSNKYAMLLYRPQEGLSDV